MKNLPAFAHYQLQKIFKNIEKSPPSLEQIENLVQQGVLDETSLSLDFFRFLYLKAPVPIFQVFAKASPQLLKPQILGWALTQVTSYPEAKILIEKGADLKAIAPNGLPAWLAISQFEECLPEFKKAIADLSVPDFKGKIKNHRLVEYMEWVLKNSCLSTFSEIIDTKTGVDVCLCNDVKKDDLTDDPYHTPKNLFQYILLELIHPQLSEKKL